MDARGASDPAPARHQGCGSDRPGGGAYGEGVRPVLAYTIARLITFALVAIVLLLVGLRGFPMLLLAVALSMPLSYLAWQRQRVALTQWVVDRKARRAELRSKLRGDEDELGDAATE